MARTTAASVSSGRSAVGGQLRLSDKGWRLLQEVGWIALAALGLYLLLILLTYHKSDPGWSHAVASPGIANLGGRVGAWFADLLLYLFGLSSYLLVALMGVSVVRGWRALRALPADDEAAEQRFAWERWLGFGLLLLGCVGVESARLHSLQVDMPLAPGGIVGAVLSDPLFDALGPVGGTLALLVLVAAGFSLWSGWSWLQIFERIGYALEWLVQRVAQAISAQRDRRIGEVAASARTEQVQEKRRILEDDPEPVRIAVPVARIERSERVEAERQTPLFADLPADTQLPPVSLLDEPPVAQETVSQETLEYTSRLIEKKLADFNVAANVVAAYPGPVITRYEIEPATGVKGSQIVNLSKDLARALSLVSIRVVETIPGKNLMGLELPNSRRQTVRLSEILGSQVYATSASPITLALGKDIAGNPMVADLAKMPHLLVAGTTGSGKSVGINAMLLSLLYKSDPTQVRLILIDPKMLEMSVYEGIPHLLAPVVTDMRQAGNALNWCVAEMERRYRVMSKLGVRNLSGYNQKIADAQKREELIPNPFSLTPDAPEPLDKLPQIVVFIDELADLMMVVGKKIEELIARLAQKARAAGIHLILATQRPSVDVITGLIKANIPTRIAFQVSSKIDSRTILDQMGAESLLGQGDMLYMPSGSGVPVRVHGAFVADEEVHKVVEHWKQLADPQYIEGILEGGVPEEVDSGSAVGFGGLSQTLAEAGVDGEADPMYDQAVAVVIKHKRASISLVQRHLRIGYNRAARLLEQMEKSGLVSAMASNGNRELLVPTSQE
ncbi:MAG: DNA translocase FtsK 4TM domain-containing protein [Burkholderiales bacterium]|nr:DNA translocase FtsK 4TM domain-containing protein [Burkholderiales bacterium]